MNSSSSTSFRSELKLNDSFRSGGSSWPGEDTKGTQDAMLRDLGRIMDVGLTCFEESGGDVILSKLVSVGRIW